MRISLKNRLKFTPFSTVIYVFVILWCAVFFACSFWLVMNAFKSRNQFLVDNIGWPDPFSIGNFGKAFSELARTGKSVPVMVFNSLWRTIGSIAISTASCHFLAYCLSKYKFPGRNVIYWTSIITMMLPVYGTLPAQLKLYYALGIYDSPLILISAIGIGGILIPYACYSSLSWSFAEAAFLDGAGHFTVYFKIMLPQMVPIITALSVTAFIGGWNDYMNSIVFMPSYFTLSTGLYIYQQETAREYQYTVLFAGILMSIVPVVVLFSLFQKTLLQVDISGGLKG